MSGGHTSPGAWVGIGAVRVYQWTLGPVLGGQCRFAPSCSDYAIEALARHGALRGAGLAAWRVLRCQPWCEGGYDPVPESGPRAPEPGAGDADRMDADRMGADRMGASRMDASRMDIDQAGH